MVKKAILYLTTTVFLIGQSTGVSKAPDLQLEMLDGSKTTLEKMLEKGPVLVDFWATWCVPCKKEMVELEKLYKKYSDDGFTVLAVNQDMPRTMSKVKAYIRSQRFTFPVAVDPNQQIGQKMNVQVLPTTFMVDSGGSIVWQHVGFLPGDEKDIEEELLKILTVD